MNFRRFWYGSVSFCAIFLLMLGGCSRQSNTDRQEAQKLIQNDFKIRNKQIALIESSKNSVELHDDQQYLGQVIFCQYLSLDSLIVVDRSYKILLFINYNAAKTFGKIGSGKGEYKVLRSMCLHNDTLFVLDNTLAKIVGYSLTDNRCVYELIDKSLSKARAIYRIRETNKFLVANTDYGSSVGDPEEQILWTMDDKLTIEYLNFRRKELEEHLELPLPMGGNCQLQYYDGKVFMAMPFASFIVSIDTRTLQVDKIKILLDIDLEKSISKERPSLNGLDITENLYPFSGGFAVRSTVVRHDKGKSCVRFYTYSGKYLGEIVDTYSEAFTGSWSQTFYADNSKILRIVANTPASGLKHPYSIVSQNYENEPLVP